MSKPDLAAAMNAAREEWWSALSKRGDPQYLTNEFKAFDAGYAAGQRDAQQWSEQRAAELQHLLADEERENEHHLRLAFVDVGANPPVTWKERAAELQREVERLTEESAMRYKRMDWEAEQSARKSVQIADLQDACREKQEALTSTMALYAEFKERAEKAEAAFAASRDATEMGE